MVKEPETMVAIVLRESVEISRDIQSIYDRDIMFQNQPVYQMGADKSCSTSKKNPQPPTPM